MPNKKHPPGYYYLHTNGKIIHKPKIVMTNITVKDYFDSPFVVEYWTIKTEEEYKKMMKEISKIKKGK